MKKKRTVSSFFFLQTMRAVRLGWLLSVYFRVSNINLHVKTDVLVEERCIKEQQASNVYLFCFEINCLELFSFEINCNHIDKNNSLFIPYKYLLRSDTIAFEPYGGLKKTESLHHGFLLKIFMMMCSRVIYLYYTMSKSFHVIKKLL